MMLHIGWRLGKALCALLFTVAVVGFCHAEMPAERRDKAPPRFFAYRVRDDGGIAGFSVASNGDLIPLPFAPVPHTISDAAVSRSPYFPSLVRSVDLFHHSKRPALYAVAPRYQAEVKGNEVSAYFSDYQVRIFGIGADGRLVLRQNLRISQPPRTFNPDGTRLYVPLGDQGLDIYAVAENGTLRKTATSAEGGGRDTELYFGGDGPAGGENGNEYSLTFAPSGRFAYRSHRERGLDWDTTEWETFRVDARGLLHSETKPTVRRTSEIAQTRVSDWGKGILLGLNRATQCALLMTEPHDASAPFRIRYKSGAGKLRETARFGRFAAPVGEHRTIAGNVEYYASLRPDNFIEAAAVVPFAGQNGGKTESERFVARFRLQPDGSAKQIKAWANTTDESLSQTTEEGGLILSTTFVEGPRSPRSAKP